MRKLERFKSLAAASLLTVALLAPGSAWAAPVAPAPAGPSSVSAAMADEEMVSLTSSGVSYHMSMDGEDVEVFEGVYSNDHPDQVQDIRVRVKKYSHPAEVLLSDTYVAATSEYVLTSGGKGTYRLELPMTDDAMWEVAGVYAVHGMAVPKNLTAVVTSTSVDAMGHRRYFGTVTNDSNVHAALTDIVVSAEESANGSFFGQAADTTLASRKVVLAPNASTTFELVGTRPANGATPVLGSVSAQGRFQTVLGLTASSLAPKYGTYVRLTGTLRGGSPLAVVPDSSVTFIGTPLKAGDPTYRGIASWNGTAYAVSVKPVHAFRYRAYFYGNSDYAAAASAYVTVKPAVYLTTPTAPTSIARGRYFASYGYLKPYHTGYTKIYAYRYERGRWVLRKTVNARNAKYSSYTKYSASLSLPSAGKWRLRAVRLADTLHPAAYSAYRYVTVR